MWTQAGRHMCTQDLIFVDLCIVVDWGKGEGRRGGRGWEFKLRLLMIEFAKCRPKYWHLISLDCPIIPCHCPCWEGEGKKIFYKF